MNCLLSILIPIYLLLLATKIEASVSDPSTVSLNRIGDHFHFANRIDFVASNNIVEEKNQKIKKYPAGLDSDKLTLYQQIEETQTIDELFQWIDEIPAIRNCYDRAMRISMASQEDSFLAVTALYRLANILINLQTDKPHLHRHHLYLEEQHLTIDKIRRIEQLCECIELHLSSLPIEDVAKSLWSIVTIDSSDEYMQKILSEYQDRVKAHNNQVKSLTFEDIAVMIWTIGCVKDRYSTNSEALIDQLLDVFVSKVNQTSPMTTATTMSATTTDRSPFHYFSAFTPQSTSTAANMIHPTLEVFPDDVLDVVNSKLIIRMLWSLAVHQSSHPCQLSIVLQGLKVTIASLSELSITNKVSLLWCCAQFMIDDKTILLPLLKDLEDYIYHQKISSASTAGAPSQLTVYEIKYITDALCMISHAARKSYIRILENNQSSASASAANSHACSDTIVYSSITVSDLLEVLNEINAIVKQLIQYALQRSEFFETASLTGILGLFQAVTNIELLQFDETIQEFLTLCLQRFQKELNVKIASKDAAAILEYMVTIPDYPNLLTTEMENFRLRDVSFASYMTERGESGLYPTTATKMMRNTPAVSAAGNESNSNSDEEMVFKTSSIKPSVAEMINLNPVWHELAGRLSVISSLGAGDVTDKAKLVAATWSVACLGHSYRPLYRVARRATQFTLHELSAKCLARLAVSIAKEEAASFATGGGMSVKLDHEFVDQVAINTLKRAKEIDSLKELIHAMTCIAFLGRLSSSGTKLQWSATHGSPEPSSPSATSSGAMVEVPSVATRYLSTKQLIRLQWAIGRLPVGIFTPVTSQSLKNELEKRQLFTKFPDLVDSKEKVAIQDTFLYVKTLTDSIALKDHRLDYLKEKICSALMSHCEVLVSKSSSKSLVNYSLGKFSTYEKENFVMKLSILIDSLQSFIELGWFHHEMVHLCQRYLLIISSMQEQEHISNIHTKCAIQFKKGILEELLKVYQQLPYGKVGGGKLASGMKKKEKSSSLFSRFFSH